MRERAWWLKTIVVSLLGALGTLLYFSAAAYFNVLVVPMITSFSPAHAHGTVVAVLVSISFVAALISAFFSAFLYEMVGGGRPLAMSLLFALPPVLFQLYALAGSRVSTPMVSIYLFENLVIWLAYLALALAGNRVWKRYFAASDPETSPESSEGRAG